MAQLLPSALVDVINELGRLPGVGERTAERYAYFLLRTDKHTSKKLAETISKLHDNVKTCPVTFA
ncbi:MAG: recombination protein RecR, partial [Candidatus Saccharimonadaceae bacterium]|nr:recombination protein RecR [Candidatus Saccharimonadaceae bacterium]